ncbi:MAG: hypothetical protein RL300_942 [Pseudomonadota bacterium]|jgi:uncharacterized integral membrane protein
MKHILWLLRWVVKIAIFFTLFAFALNNQQVATVHFFFGNFWLAPMVLVVLGAFTIGVVVGVLGMAPWWWRHRQTQQKPAQTSAAAEPVTPPVYADGI